MNLKHLKLINEDESAFHVQDGRDNSSFKVAKKGLGKTTVDAITQHFTKGGLVKKMALGDMAEEPDRAQLAAQLSDWAKANPGQDIPPKVFQTLSAKERFDAMNAANPSPGISLSGIGQSIMNWARQGEPPPQDEAALQSQAGGFTPMPAATAPPEAPPVQAEPAPQMPATATPAQAPTAPPARSEVAVPGFSTAGYDRQSAAALKQQVDAQQQKAAIEQKQAEELGKIQQAGLLEEAAINKHHADQYNSWLADTNQAMKDVADSKIDNERWWHTRSTGQKIAAGIGMVLSGIGSAFGGGPNLALQVINDAIEKDVDAQTKDLSNKNSRVAQLMQMGKTLQEAKQLAIAESKARVAGQIQMANTNFGGQMSKPNADLASGALAEQFNKEGAAVHQAKAKIDLDAAELRMKMKAMGLKGAGQQVPASEAAGIGTAKSAVQAVDSLMKTWDTKTGALSGLAQHLPGTDAAQYNDQREGAAQMVGLFMEGGKLSDSDKPFYRDLLPSAGDSRERALAKKQNVQALIANKVKAQVQALGAAGYNTQGLAPIAEEAGMDERAKALMWLKNNPNDPKAEKVRKALGL